MTRGIRNNNPGNIRHDGTVWRGEISGSDAQFKTFKTMVWGLRAIYHLLNNYYVLYGLDTVEQMIRRWAPPEDGNRTESYISTVSSLSGIPSTRRLIPTERSMMEPIVRAMIRVETGTSLPDSNYEDAWTLFMKYKQ